VQATPRNARIDVEDVCHVVMNIGPSAAPCSATKERTSAEDAPGLPIGPPRGPFCAGESPARSFLRPQADAIIDVVLHAGRSAVIITVIGFILRPRVRSARSGMAGIWRWMKIVRRSGRSNRTKKALKWNHGKKWSH
jgi:hypothetical protein